VLLNHTFFSTPLCNVEGDKVTGGYSATKHLLALGHRRIAFVGCIGSLAYYRDRMAGYVHALIAAGVPFDPEPVCDPDLLPHGQVVWLDQSPQEVRGNTPHPAADHVSCAAVGVTTTLAPVRALWTAAWTMRSAAIASSALP
jgi:hypothetical protein